MATMSSHLAVLLLITCITTVSTGRGGKRRRHRPLRTADDADDAVGAGRSPYPTLYAAQFPLRSQPNLSDPKYRRAIRGSRRAFAITKTDYLKKDWCKTEPFKQVIRARGCRRRKIINRFCYGQCNSFFIPKHSRRDGEASAFRSCGFCKPKVTSWITVTLVCPGQQPAFRRKRVLRIKECRCMAQTLN